MTNWKSKCFYLKERHQIVKTSVPVWMKSGDGWSGTLVIRDSAQIKLEMSRKLRICKIQDLPLYILQSWLLLPVQPEIVPTENYFRLNPVPPKTINNFFLIIIVRLIILNPLMEGWGNTRCIIEMCFFTKLKKKYSGSVYKGLDNSRRIIQFDSFLFSAGYQSISEHVAMRSLFDYLLIYVFFCGVTSVMV